VRFLVFSSFFLLEMLTLSSTRREVEMHISPADDYHFEKNEHGDDVRFSSLSPFLETHALTSQA
jgi:hypothetical protein